eukprot:TRINITY_DN30452_c0_g1_i1.p1 TRINITY_DN30452_c0_g1~~TRINITY_DN30452_c0_g1_i1.p1  ORF type:complete len:381 (+),score=41.35 TRINITY_DN30452_c0_g1_i1:61-1203(+)
MSTIPVTVQFFDLEVSGEVYPDTTVDELKNQVADECGLDADQFTLSFEGNDLLEGNKPLMTIGVMEWSVLNAEISQKGIALRNLSELGLKPTLKWFMREIKNKGPNIQSFIDAGVPLNTSRSTYTPLTAAIRYGNLQAFAIMLSAPGIDVNQQDTRLMTPLCQACWDESFECIEMLLNQPMIDVNKISGKNQSTPLGTASGLDRVRVVKMLLSDHRVDVNSGNRERTPLGIACSVDNEVVVSILSKHPGVLINKRSRTFQTPLFEACKRYHVKSINHLLQVPSLDVMCATGGQTPIDFLISDGKLNLARRLMKHQSYVTNRSPQQMFIIVTYLFVLMYFLSTIVSQDDIQSASLPVVRFLESVTAPWINGKSLILSLLYN